MKGGKQGYLPGEIPDSDDESVVKPPPRQPTRPPEGRGKSAPPQLPTLPDDNVLNNSPAEPRNRFSLVGMVRRASVVAINMASEIATDYDMDGENEKARLKEQTELAAAGGGKAGMMKLAAKKLNLESMSPFRRWTFYLITWPGFDTIMGLVVVGNGITIGLETVYKSRIPLGCDEECKCESQIPCVAVPSWVRLVDYAFLGSYTIELGLRFVVFQRETLRNPWVRFDFFLVFVGLIDVIVSVVGRGAAVLKQMMLLRMLRLARLARMLRLMAQFANLWTLVQGLLLTFVPLVWTLVVTSILMFIFAVLGMEIFDINMDLPLNHPFNVAVQYEFRHFMDAGMLMMQVASFDNICGVYRPMTKQSTPIFLFFWLAILIFSIALMNLITAIIVEGSMSMAAQDKEVAKMLLASKKKKQMENLKVMFRELDEDGSGEVSQDEITQAPEDVLEHLTEIAGTDDIPALFEMLDYDGGGTLEVDEFCEGVFKATTSSKPMEIDRMVKQCNDILFNQRSAVAILNGKEASSKISCDNSQKGSKNSQEKNSKEQPQGIRAENPVLRDMENRCEQLNARIQALKDSTAKLLRGVEQLPTPLCSPKKAVAIFKGFSAKTNRPQTSRAGFEMPQVSRTLSAPPSRQKNVD